MTSRREISVKRFGDPSLDPLTDTDLAVLMGDRAAGRNSDPDRVFCGPTPEAGAGPWSEYNLRMPAGPFPEAADVGGVAALQTIDVRSNVL